MTSKQKKRLQLILFFAYCAFIIWYTLLTRKARTDHKLVLRLFWSFRALAEGSPHAADEVKQYFKNIIFFIPFGLLVPWKQKGWITVLISAATLSIMIELAQLIFKLGWCELDDVICNTLGALLGYLLALAWKRIIKERHNNVL